MIRIEIEYTNDCVVKKEFCDVKEAVRWLKKNDIRGQDSE